MPIDHHLPAKRKFLFSLRSQILVVFLILFSCSFVLVTLAFLFGIPFTNFAGIIEETEREAFTELNLVADLKKESLERWIGERRSDVRLLAKNPMVVSFLQELSWDTSSDPARIAEQQRKHQPLKTYLKEMQISYKDYEEIELLNYETGHLLATTNPDKSTTAVMDLHRERFPPGSEELITLELINSKLYLRIHRFIKEAGMPGREGMLAEVDVLINTDDFIRPILHTGEGLGNSGEVLLVTQDRRIVTSLKYPLPDGSTADLLAYQITASPSRFAAAGHQGSVSAIDYRGVSVLAAYRHIQITTELAWGMVVKVDRDEVYRARITSVATLLGMIIAAMLLVALVSYFISRRLSKTIAEMVRVAQKVESGEHGVRIVKKRNDEIGILALSINRMIDQLQRWNEKLEWQVEERTADLKETAEELRLQSEIVSRMDEGVYLLRMDGTIVYANPKFEEMFGYEPGEMIGMHASTINYPTETSPEETAGEILGILDKEGIWKGEIKNIKKDGTPFFCYASVVLFNHASHGKLIVAVHNDITERKRAEKDKKYLEAKLVQAQKMEAIGTLAGGIAHDFNNILAVILGYADLAIDDAPPDSKLVDDLEKILQAGYRAKDLVKQILAFSRQTEIEWIPIKVQPLIKEALKMLRSSMPSTIKIENDIDPECGIILADPTQVHQILMNLCTNANHAMEKGGGILKIALKCVSIDKGKRQAALDIEPGEYVELTVSDTGFGIGPDVIGRIFDPYFTTKERGKGTGMGLAIIHGIVKDCGGAITAESELGKGSVFHVYFPVIEQEELLPVADIEPLSLGQERILFIDDEDLLLKVGQDMLERLGYSVTVRNSSLDALATFQNSPEDFDVIITDQTMPGMTGVDLARRMLQIRPDIPIILCTGYSNLIDEPTAKSIGIREFALKPMTKDTIAKLIRKVLDAF